MQRLDIELTARDALSTPPIRVLLVESDQQFARWLRQSLASSTSSRIELIHCERQDQVPGLLTMTAVAAVLIDLELEYKLACFGVMVEIVPDTCTKR